MNEHAAAAVTTAHDRLNRSTRLFNHFHRYRNVLRRRWWVLPLTLCLGLGIAGFRLWQSPPSYLSFGRMIVNIKITISTGSVYSEELSNFLGTQAALMKSGTVLSRAMERVRAIKPNLNPVPVILQVSVSPKTAIFNLEAVGSEPQYTRAYLDACMDEYINLKREMRTSTSETTLQGITEQLVSLERDLKKTDDELLAFQATNSVVFLQEQGNSAGSYLAQLNRQLAQLKTESQLLNMLNLDQNLERQQKQDVLAAAGDDKEQPNMLLRSDYLKAKQEIQLMKAELQEWSQYLKPKHPRIIALNEEIASREKLLEIFKQQSLEDLESRRNSLKLQTQNLEREVKEWEVKSLDISKRMAEYERIRATKQRLQTQYRAPVRGDAIPRRGKRHHP